MRVITFQCRFVALVTTLSATLTLWFPFDSDARGHRGGSSHSRSHSRSAARAHVPPVAVYPAYPVYAPLGAFYPGYAVGFGVSRYGYPYYPYDAFYARANAIELDRTEFLRLNPCPASGEPTTSCPGYVLDREQAVAGTNAPRKLYWRAIEEQAPDVERAPAVEQTPAAVEE